MKYDTHNVFFKMIGILGGAALLLPIMSLPVSADENASLHGKTLGEWSARWWQWQEANFPNFEFGDGFIDCSEGQSGPVWFLGGTDGNQGSVRECIAPIKGHKHLLFPLINASFFNEIGDPQLSVDDKRFVLDGLFSEDPPGSLNSKACQLQVEVNDVPVVFSAPIVRTQSPPFMYAGDSEAVADGFWIALSPLPRGDHTIHFTGNLCDIDTGAVVFAVEVTYLLTIH